MVCLIGLSLLYLNSTAYSLWAAGGPPTEVPNAWLHRALVNFGYSISLFAGAILAFKVLKTGFSINKSKSVYIWLLIIASALVYPQAKEYLLIDSCLDSGGKWSEQYFECQK